MPETQHAGAFDDLIPTDQEKTEKIWLAYDEVQSAENGRAMEKLGNAGLILVLALAWIVIIRSIGWVLAGFFD